MTNAALELADVFDFWWTQAEQNGHHLLQATSKHLSVESSRLLTHLSTLVAGVDKQIRDMELAGHSVSHFRDIESKWADAAFMRMHSWHQGSRSATQVIDKSSIAVLRSLGHVHPIATRHGEAPSVLFMSLLEDLSPIREALADVQAPPQFKLLLDQRVDSLSTLLAHPSVPVDVVLTRLTELIGILTFLLMRTEGDEGAKSFREKASAWVSAVVLNTTANVASGVVIGIATAYGAPLMLGG